jgi:hypothetical protein
MLPFGANVEFASAASAPPSRRRHRASSARTQVPAVFGATPLRSVQSPAKATDHDERNRARSRARFSFAPSGEAASHGADRRWSDDRASSLGYPVGSDERHTRRLGRRLAAHGVPRRLLSDNVAALNPPRRRPPRWSSCRQRPPSGCRGPNSNLDWGTDILPGLAQRVRARSRKRETRNASSSRRLRSLARLSPGSRTLRAS